jgi:hypothetical protein
MRCGAQRDLAATRTACSTVHARAQQLWRLPNPRWLLGCASKEVAAEAC